MDPHEILLIFLPALIFESAFNCDWHTIKMQFSQILIMAGPMVLLNTLMSAITMRYILGYNDSKNFTWNAALLFGSIISATDPVAVVALLKELGASKRLATVIEGESLLNDGTAMVIFSVLLNIVEGQDIGAGEIFLKFIRLSFGGPAMGILFGVIVSMVLERTHNNFILEVNTTIIASYTLFFVCEVTDLKVSGILAIVAIGLYMTHSGKTKISAESKHSVHHVWGYIGFVAETVIFLLSGIIIGHKMEEDNLIELQDFFCLIGNYIILHFIRFGSLLLFWPILKKLGYG